MKSLKLGANNLASLTTETLVAVLSGLEEVDLEDTVLTRQQVNGIFTMLSTVKDHQLRLLLFEAWQPGGINKQHPTSAKILILLLIMIEAEPDTKPE